MKKPANMRRYWLSFFKFLCLDQELRRGRDYRHTPCDTVIPNGGAPNASPTVPHCVRFFIPLPLTRASSARVREIKNALVKDQGTVELTFAGWRGQLSNIFVKDLLKINHFIS
jgi:hypothetical protein